MVFRGGIYYDDIRQLEHVTVAMDEHLLVKKAGTIEAKGMIIATKKTQNHLETSPSEVRSHPDLAKAAILVELLRWVTKNQALRRHPRRQAVNLLTSRYVFTWKETQTAADT